MMIGNQRLADEQPDDGKASARGEGLSPAAPSMPELTPGRFGMWVFLSTEIMLFAGCIGAVLILRISSLEQGWPSAASMGTDLVKGLANTVLLIVSGLTATAAVKNAVANRAGAAKTLLLLTLVLGSAFIVVKFTEYRHKYRLGLLSLSSSQNVFDKADRNYLSAVDSALSRHISRLEQLKESRPLDADEAEHLEWAYRLRSGLTLVVANRIGRGLDPLENQVQLDLLAWQVFPHDKELFGRPKEAVDLDNLRMVELANEIETRSGLARERITLLDHQATAMEKGDLKTSDSSAVQDGAVNLPADLTAAQWLESRRAQQQELKAELASLDRELARVRDRQQVLALIGNDSVHEGINERMSFRLPVAVKNGQAWQSSWLLLSGIHGLHVLGGLVAFLFFLPATLNARTASSLGVVVLYWQFVDVVWLLIFGLLYF